MIFLMKNKQKKKQESICKYKVALFTENPQCSMLETLEIHRKYR